MQSNHATIERARTRKTERRVAALEEQVADLRNEVTSAELGMRAACVVVEQLAARLDQVIGGETGGHRNNLSVLRGHAPA